MAPPASCWSFAFRKAGRLETELLSHYEGAHEVMDLLRRAAYGECVLAFQNGPYDFAVLAAEYPQAIPLIFDAHEAGGIHDTMYAEQLIDIARGTLRLKQDEDTGEYTSAKSYGLEAMANQHLRAPFYKDEWRMRYVELRDVAIADYPEAAAKYPQLDAEYTLRIAELQRDIARDMNPHDPLVAALSHTCRTYLALHYASCWGRELDPDRVAKLHAATSAYCDTFVPDLEKVGLVNRVRKGAKAGTITKKKAPLQALVVRDWIERLGGEYDQHFDRDWSIEDCTTAVLADPANFLPENMLTDGGTSGVRQVKCAASVLQDAVDPRLTAMALFLEAEKLRTSFAVPLQKFGYGPTHARYGFAETGRTTCSGGSKRNRMALNDQQMPRKLPKALALIMLEQFGEEIDVRSCYVARDGWMLSSVDFASLEMCTFAQVCIWMVGFSKLAEAINQGVDPHTLFACALLGTSYEEALALVKASDVEATAMRQRAKVGNFGFPGGMGAAKFRQYAKQQGVIISEADAKHLKSMFLDRWPEAKDYFTVVGDLIGEGDAVCVQHGSERVRGGMRFTDACNGFFQGLAADGATEAVWNVTREMYDERLGSVLYGSRISAFVHDEIIAEHPACVAHEAAERMTQVMIETMQRWVPDVKISAEPALMTRWMKGAKTVRDHSGRLQPWEPENKKGA